jgi:mono/diheme cytochrome c family protein
MHRRRSNHGATTDKWQAPPEAAAKPNPESGNQAAPAAGRKLFMRICSSCHAQDGSGQNSSAANLRTREVQVQSDGALFWKITNGNTTHGMPSYAALSETSRWDIVTFLRTLSDSNSNTSGRSGERKKEAPPPERRAQAAIIQAIVRVECQQHILRTEFVTAAVRTVNEPPSQ